MNTVVITGVSRGIGKAVAGKFLERGWQVIGGSKSGFLPYQHPALLVLKVDLSREDSILNFVDQIRNNYSEINVLINNAGVLLDAGEEMDLKQLQSTLEVNLFGLISITEKLLSLIPKGGQIINLSSQLGSISNTLNGFYPAYRISKASVNMYTRILSARLSESGIGVSSIDPGWVRTDMGGEGAQREPSEPAGEIYDLATSGVHTGYFWHRGTRMPW